MAASTVQTVLGPIAQQDLGKTLMHEHVILGYPGWDQDSLYEFDHAGTVERVARALDTCGPLGIRTLLDATPIELGRRPLLLAEVSQRTGLNIICATGLYHGGVGLHTYWRMKDIDELAEVFVHEIEDGVGDPPVRAGVIKVATRTNSIVPNEEKVLRAAAGAAVATGVPVTTHTEEGQLGPEQIALLGEEGLPPHRVIVGHLDNARELDTVRRVLELGAFAGYDQIGYEFRVKDQRRLDDVAALVKDGYAGQLILSHDRVGLWLGRLTPFLQQFQDLVDAEGFGYLDRVFLPALRERGVSDDDIDQMLVRNPARYFAGEPADSAQDAARNALRAAPSGGASNGGSQTPERGQGGRTQGGRTQGAGAGEGEARS